eukprot:scaffold3685_cov102-Isochrysis_galbana.AAC.15
MRIGVGCELADQTERPLANGPVRVEQPLTQRADQLDCLVRRKRPPAASQQRGQRVERLGAQVRDGLVQGSQRLAPLLGPWTGHPHVAGPPRRTLRWAQAVHNQSGRALAQAGAGDGAQPQMPGPGRRDRTAGHAKGESMATPLRATLGAHRFRVPACGGRYKLP